MAVQAFHSLCLLLAAAVLCSCAPVDPQTPVPPAGCEWSLVWSDEFNDNQLDLTKWRPNVDCWGGGNNELECYTSRQQNLRVEQGHLVLQAVQETYTGSTDGCTRSGADCTNTKPYTSGKVNSVPDASWSSGRIAVRAKLPKGGGLWPAIWMMPTDNKYGTWAASGEIDIMESKGQSSNMVQNTIFFGDVWPYQSSITSGLRGLSCVADFADDYHVFALEWGYNSLVWLVDGTITHKQSLRRSFQVNGPNHPYAAERQPFDQRFFLLLNLAVGGNYGGAPSPTDWSSSALLIDWVRIYQTANQALPSDQLQALQQCFDIQPNSAGSVVRQRCRPIASASVDQMCGVLGWLCSPTGGALDCGNRNSCDPSVVRDNAAYLMDYWYQSHPEQGDWACNFTGAGELYMPVVTCTN
eukprot:jgi/Chlat1/3999/Chrsp26S03989